MLREAAVPKEQYVAAQTSGHPCRPEKLKAISHRRHRQSSRGVQSNRAYVGTEQLIFLRLLHEPRRTRGSTYDMNPRRLVQHCSLSLTEGGEQYILGC